MQGREHLQDVGLRGQPEVDHHVLDALPFRGRGLERFLEMLGLEHAVIEEGLSDPLVGGCQILGTHGLVGLSRSRT